MSSFATPPQLPGSTPTRIGGQVCDREQQELDSVAKKALFNDGENYKSTTNVEVEVPFATTSLTLLPSLVEVMSLLRGMKCLIKGNIAIIQCSSNEDLEQVSDKLRRRSISFVGNMEEQRLEIEVSPPKCLPSAVGSKALPFGPSPPSATAAQVGHHNNTVYTCVATSIPFYGASSSSSSTGADAHMSTEGCMPVELALGKRVHFCKNQLTSFSNASVTSDAQLIQSMNPNHLAGLQNVIFVCGPLMVLQQQHEITSSERSRKSTWKGHLGCAIRGMCGSCYEEGCVSEIPDSVIAFGSMDIFFDNSLPKLVSHMRQCPHVQARHIHIPSPSSNTDKRMWTTAGAKKSLATYLGGKDFADASVKTKNDKKRKVVVHVPSVPGNSNVTLLQHDDAV